MTEPQKLSLDPNENIRTQHVIFVELDALLDTRLGTLHGIDPMYGIAAFRSPDYYQRASDDFTALCEVTQAQYNAAYARRNEQTLQDSILTGVCFLLNDVCSKLEEQRLSSPFVESVEVQINLWPYQLDEDTRFWIENAVASFLPVDVTVSSISLPLDQLTLQLIKSTYTGLVLYHFADWMTTHCRDFEHTQIPGVTVIAPKLHREGQQAFTSKDLGEGLEHLDPYEAIEIAHAPLLGLEWEPVELFCIARPDTIASFTASEPKDAQEGP